MDTRYQNPKPKDEGRKAKIWGDQEEKVSMFQLFKVNNDIFRITNANLHVRTCILWPLYKYQILTGSSSCIWTTSPMAPDSISSFIFLDWGIYLSTWQTAKMTLFSSHVSTISTQSSYVTLNISVCIYHLIQIIVTNVTSQSPIHIHFWPYKVFRHGKLVIAA